MTELDGLVEQLGSPDEAERIYAAEDIGYANRAEAVRPLLARLPVETSRAVREAIFAALQSVEDDSVIEGAIGLLASEDTFVRNQAVELLRQRGSKAISFLRKEFRSAKKDQRKMVVDVLAAVDGPGSEEIYDWALNDRDVNVVITAVENLGNAGKTQFRERIEKLAATVSPMLVGACLEALVLIGNAQSLAVFRIAAPEPVADFLLPSYLKLLGAHGDESAIGEAGAMMDSRGVHLHAHILDTITTLRRRYPSAPLPKSLVKTLGNILDNGNSQLRRQAARLLDGPTLENHGG